MATTATTPEREAKFEVDRDYDPPDLRGLVERTERLPEQHLRTVYYDTSDRRLAERGLSLRHRTTETAGQPGIEETWTLKVPDGPEDDFLTRGETSWSGARDTVPAPAAGILRGVIRREPLRPVAELDTTRRRLQLIGTDKVTPLGELDDDRVTVVGGPGDGSWFRQIELELAADGAAEVDAILDSLRGSGARPTNRSKLSIGLAQAPEHRGPRSGQKRRKRQTVSDIVTTAIGSNLDRLLDHDYRLRIRRDDPDPHDVHQARVATRRLRSNLKMLADVLDPVWLNHTRDELRWVGTVLGEVRDLDVLAANLHEGDTEPAGAAELTAMIRPERKSAAKKLSTALNSRRYLDLLDRLHAARQIPPLLPPAGTPAANRELGPDTKAKDAFPLLVGQEWRALRRKVRKARKARKSNRRPSDLELHKIRIRSKRLRYAAETATPLIGKRAEKVAEGAEALQDLLGEARDRGAAAEWVRQRVQETPLTSTAAFASGRIAERHQARQADLQDRWEATWRHLDRKRNRKWLR